MSDHQRALGTDMSRSDWRGFVRGLIRFFREEMAEPEHARDQYLAALGQDKEWEEQKHPRDHGKFSSKPGGSGGTLKFAKGGRVPSDLHGVEFASWTPPADWKKVEGQARISEPPLPKTGKKISTGLVMVEPDGRTWLSKPTNAYGGYKHTFPKGNLEKSLSPQANAIKEAYEETGLRGEVTGYLGDYEGDTSVTRLYVARRTGGTPLDHGWESEGVILAHPDDAPELLNRSRDKKIFADLRKHLSKHQARDAGIKIYRWSGARDSKHAGKIIFPPWKDRRWDARRFAQMALDRSSVRSYDADGRLHVAVANISKATVNPYYGREIPDSERLGLDPDRMYRLLRDPDELRKAARTFDGIPVLSRHVPVSADAHRHDLVVGSTGSDAKYVHPYLQNSLKIWVRDAIEDVENDVKKQLSAGYRYKAVMEDGVYEGQHYDGRMVDIIGNHVALVREGRAGSDVVVGDSAP